MSDPSDDYNNRYPDLEERLDTARAEGRREGEAAMLERACAWVDEWTDHDPELMRTTLQPPAATTGAPCDAAGPHDHRYCERESDATTVGEPLVGTGPMTAAGKALLSLATPERSRSESAEDGLTETQRRLVVRTFDTWSRERAEGKVCDFCQGRRFVATGARTRERCPRCGGTGEAP